MYGRILVFGLLSLFGFFGLFSGQTSVSGQQVRPVSRVEPVTESCLGCICEAVSNCNRSITTCDGDVCGILRITWAYWADAGKPTLVGDNPEAPEAYPRCTNEPACAGRTVTNYMNRFAKDCNGDGVINCYDYARIHRLGGYGCGNALDLPYQQKFENCQSVVAQFSTTNQG